MFQFIQKHQKLIQIAMGLLFVPFVFGGLTTSVRDFGRAPIVAELGEDSIDLQEFEKRYTQYKERERQRLGDAFDEAAYNTNDKRLQFLNQMVDEAVVKHAILTEKLAASDAAVAQMLQADSNMPKNAQGAVDMDALAKILKANQMSEQDYLNESRSRLSMTRFVQPIGFGVGLLPFQKDFVQNYFSKMQLVEKKDIDMSAYLAAINVTPAATKEYYDAHHAEFTRAATFDIEYAFIPMVEASYVPTDDDIKKFSGAGGAQPTAAELQQFRQDPVKVKMVAQKALLNKLASEVAQASSGNPKDMDALAAKFSVKKEVFAGLTRASEANLPDLLKNPAIRSALANGEMATSNAISQPMPVNGGVLVGRVAKSTAPGLQPFDLVQAEIETTLKNKSALAKIAEEYQAKIPSMNAALPLSTPLRVGFFNPDGLSNVALGKVMATSTYPSLFLSQTDKSISVVRVISAAPALPFPEAQLANVFGNWSMLDESLQNRAFLDALRQRYGVKLFAKKLNTGLEVKSPA